MELCPRDSTPFDKVQAGPASFDFCRACGGVWVANDQLDLYLESHAEAWKLPLEPPDAPPAGLSEDTIRCPCSLTPMKVVRRSGIQIDVCAECESIWLDGGELSALLKKSRPEAYADGSGSSQVRRILVDVADEGAMEMVARFVGAVIKRLPGLDP